MSNKPYVIVEIGSNHNGRIENALKMIDMAALAGVDAVKLQKRHNKTLFTDEMYNRPYEGYGPTYGAHREALEFNFAQFVALKNYAESKDLTFFATPFDIRSVEFLEKLEVTQYKVASALVTNHILLKAIAETKKPVIMSAGGQNIISIDRALQYFDRERIALLHCVAAYPCPVEIMNLGRIADFKEIFGCTVGLSDHQDGIALGPAAYALGARVFEKHITLDHNAKGTDHRFSLELYGLMQYVKYLHQTAEAMVRHDQPIEREIAPIQKMGQSLYWVRTLPRWKKVAEDDFMPQSPQQPEGILPTPLNVVKFIGRPLERKVERGDLVSWDDVK